MRSPAFWSRPDPGWPATLLGPFEGLTARMTARRLARPGWRAPVPVICCGNVGVGGAGKTTLALDLALSLRARGLQVHCLTRGYGGNVGRGARSGGTPVAPLRVDPDHHDAAMVGDEALLLAQVAPCWVGADRMASGQAAVAAGAQILLMDDGLQNPGLVQDWPLLVIDGAVGFGNGRLLPAGPLREPVSTAAARAACAILIGRDATGSAQRLPPGLPTLHADLEMDPELLALRGQRLLAFAGIARPAKFFDALTALGLTLVSTRAHPDHHRYRPRELEWLRTEAGRLGALLVTTPKDAVRLPLAFQAQLRVARVSLRWHDPDAYTALLDKMVGLRAE